MEHVAIVGAGQAGAALAICLRKNGYDGQITIYGNENDPPYQRPPLSKKYLSGEWDRERLWLRPLEFWQEQGIWLRLGRAVQKLSPADRSLVWGDETYSWTKLALTTGARPRPLPEEFQNRTNVFELRNLADVDKLRATFSPGARLLIVGGGYIGLETAAVAAQVGLRVDVIERAPRVLERVACVETADAICELHKQNGVAIHEGRSVVGTEGSEALRAVTLDNGVRLECDLVVVGVGVLPDTRLAGAAGMCCDTGIVVDQFGRTSAPDIWAAGDCTRLPLLGASVTLESVQNAIDQAETVAYDMLGTAQPYEPVPWFWSDQYNTKLQIVGLSRGYDRVVSRASEKGHSNWYFRNNRLIAVDALNDGRAYMLGKKLLEAGKEINPDLISRPDFDPMALLRA
ncbi:FAD-dependent oxidoreductase [Pusillimonas sp. MFBS29]|uniref:NAD(P)/FAD-dependent oxidoreductase n=1 Tax=Pusillimonas sp. MFBS29 TaxID=2886690 RepID=UPI001D0F5C48|nr:FAD-dependent oxidoreductase [Pusillimonas sp. MFBS29]MCC2596997.1 FAD-dependent oxidoreductase [Pusillimonas sp. MFBS29]